MIDRHHLTKSLADLCGQDFREVELALESALPSGSLVRRATVWATFLAGLSSPDGVLSALEHRWETARKLRRTSVPNDVQKKRITLRDQGLCRYCGKAVRRGTRCFDHVMPWSRGGRNRDDNLVLACRACNVLKGARTPDEAGMPLLSVPEARYG